MRNKYAGTCYRCGKVVESGGGHFERHNGGWRTQHANCAIVYRGTDKKADTYAALAAQTKEQTDD